MGEKTIMKGRSQGKTTGVTVAHLTSADAAGNISVEPIDAGDFYIQGALNHESAAADWELSAKRSAFFLQLEHQAQSWATSDIHMPSLLKSGLFRTISDKALLCAWGWQLPAKASWRSTNFPSILAAFNSMQSPATVQDR